MIGRYFCDDTIIQHCVDPERSQVLVKNGKFPLWITRKYGKIQSCTESMYSILGGTSAGKTQFSWVLQGKVKIMSMKDIGFKISVESFQLNSTIDNFSEHNISTLSFYLTRKKSKNHMVDIEENGVLLDYTMSLKKMYQSKIGPIQFDVSMKNLSLKDVIEVMGFAIVKRKQNSPTSDFPIVLGYANFSLNKPSLYTLPHTRSPYSTTIHTLGQIRYHDVASLTDKQALNFLEYYSKKTKVVHRILNQKKHVTTTVNFEEFKFALEILNIVILESRAKIIFDLVHADHKDVIDFTELETALMIVSSVDNVEDLEIQSPFDVYFSFCDKNKIMNKRQFIECVKTLKTSTIHNEIELSLFFEKIKSQGTKGASMDYELFKKIWCLYLADIEIEHTQKETKVKTSEEKNTSIPEKLLNSIPNVFKSLNLSRREDLLKRITRKDEELLNVMKTTKKEIYRQRAKARNYKDRKSRSKSDQVAAYHRNELIARSLFKHEHRVHTDIERKEQQKKKIEEKNILKKMQIELDQRASYNNNLISLNKTKKEVSCAEEIKQKGKDTLILKNLNIKRIPDYLYLEVESKDVLSTIVDLDLSGNLLAKIPNDGFFFHLNALKRLNLSRNCLQNLPLEISNLGNIEILHLNRNQLTTLPEEIKHLKRLVILKCSFNKIASLPHGIGGAISLKVFEIDCNSLMEIPKTIGNLSNLEKFSLCQNNLYLLPDEFCHLSNLIQTNLSKNNLIRIPENIGLLEELENLNLASNRIYNIPDSFGYLRNLKKLEIQQNVIQHLPRNLRGWNGLVDMDLKKNKIMKFPSCLGDLDSVQRIFASNNQIECLPAEVGLLGSLQDLQLHSNCLVSIPIEIGALVMLQTLDLSQNKIESLPKEFCFLQSLRFLNVSNNRLNSIPDAFGALMMLEQINMANNKIRHLPLSISELGKLEEFDLSSNYITSFSSTFCLSLKKLTKLDLASNQIILLPQEISKLENVKKINLHHNKLRAIPLEFTELLDQLQFIDLSRNPFDMLPFKNNSTNSSIYDNPSGYSTSEVIEWCRWEVAYWSAVREEWDSSRKSNNVQRYGVNSFIYGNDEFKAIGVLARLKSMLANKGTNIKQQIKVVDWELHLVPKIKRLYFRSKSLGYLPTYHALLSLEQQEEEKILREAVHRKAENSVQQTREKDLQTRGRLQSIYFDNLSRRIAHVEEKAIARRRETKAKEMQLLLHEAKLREMKIESQRKSKQMIGKWKDNS